MTAPRTITRLPLGAAYNGPECDVAMTKAAAVHDEAARRIRRAINLEPTEDDQP